MKISFAVPALFAVFAPAENAALAEAKVVTSSKKTVKLSGIGNSIIELPYEGEVLSVGQTIQFNAAGEIQGTPKTVAPKAAKTGGASPAFQAPVTGRDGFARRVD